MTSNLHPYHPYAVDLTHEPSSQHPRHCRAAILCRFKVARDGTALWVASVKHSPGDRAQTVRLPAHLGPDAAAAHLIGRLGLGWRMLPAAGSVDGGETYCYVAELTPGEGQALAAGERAVLALAAAAELEALTLGDPTADPVNPYGLAVALARMGTGTDHPRPLITGAIVRGDGVVILDHLRRDVCRMPGRCSLCGALAAAQAAGWQLSTHARTMAARHPSDPDPEAVALALEALGGCPAVISTLRAQGVAS